jgi:cation-transporting ATPase E
VIKERGDEMLSGSFVAAGSGRFRATRVGAQAYAAQLAEQGRRFGLTRSELRSGIDQILRIVTWLLIPTGALLAVSQFRSSASVRDALRNSVAGTVPMVPEGLVLLTSVAFAVGVVRLAKRRVLVQELPAVEVLARVDVLCIDKTGTLTEGRLVVDEVEPLAEDGSHRAALAALAAAEPHPNATLLAIRESFPGPSDGWLAASTVPFSAARKWSGADFGTRGTWVLGAPDVLLGSRPGDDADLTKARAHAEAGRRVVLLGRTDAPIGADAGPVGLVPIAFVILTDRVRETASTTLAYFARQGVDVKVISGDHPQTVAAVARRVGLPGARAPLDA